MLSSSSSSLYAILYIGSNSWSNRRLGTVGIALPQVKLRIIDPATLKELPTDTDGEVRTARTHVLTHL